MADNKKSLITLGNLETYHKNLSEQLSQNTVVDNIENITYSDLKNLRDDNGLSPGRLYRITDYVTIANEQNVRSAGHPFNIIVEALNENTLSERAKAIQDENDGYFDSEKLEAWDLWYCLDNDANRFDWGVSTVYDSSSCVINSNLIDGNAFKTPFAFSGYMWNDPINGNEYESKVENDLIYEWGFEEEPNGNKSLYLLKSDVDIYNEEGTVDTNDKFYYRGVIEADGIEYDYWQKYETYENSYILGDGGTHFALTERIVEGNIIEFQNGKGIIYRMIDEYGNDCPYDFKNIMFKRPNADDNKYYFTFSWAEEDGNIIDASIFGNNGYLLDDENVIPGVFSNIIGKYIYNGVNKLPVNIFISDYNFDGCYYGCRNNSFGNDCYNNTFGNYCNNNTFGENCRKNSFGNYCTTNTLGNACYNNSFGNDCHDNEFGNTCNSNSFGNYCNRNSFGNYCSNNSFGNDCYNNEFGTDSQFNTFGDECYYNAFGDWCSDNSLGYNCSNNTLCNGCYHNSFGDSCHGNSFGVGCYNNTFGINFSNNTFGNECYENSFSSECLNNTFGVNCFENTFGADSCDNTLGNDCNNNTFGVDCYSNILGTECYDNSFGEQCYSNTLDSGNNFNTLSDNCSYNSFGTNCSDNSLGDNCHSNSLGNDCIENIFGNDCYTNTLGNSCGGNSFGYKCVSNSFDNKCYNNTLGNNCSGNSFGYECVENQILENSRYNTFGHGCSRNITDLEFCGNTFGDNCCDNTFGLECQDNSFGNNCHKNYIGDGSSNNSFKNNCTFNSIGAYSSYNSFENNCNNNIFKNQQGFDIFYSCNNHFSDNCSYNRLYPKSIETTSDNELRNINISKGVSGTENELNNIPIQILNADYEIKVAKNSSGELKIYCEADLIA